jgi:response regulator RpfG family c-di-GMP phosphodiesterase
VIASKPRILCVDDEPLVLDGLKVNLRAAFEVVTAPSGEEALARLAQSGPFAVILSDMRMPRMTGSELLSRTRAAYPETVRILLTGQSELSTAIQAVNEGQVFRFLTKPCPFDALKAALLAGVEQHRLLGAERELLEKTLTGAVRALVEVLALADPTAFGRSERLRRTVVALTDRLSIAAAWPIEMAAQLSPLGSIQLPKPLVHKLNAGLAITVAEQQLVERASVHTDELLGNIPRMEPVREILGCPAIRSPRALLPASPEATPLGARILLVALHLDLLESSGHSPPQALAALQARTEQFDPVILEALAEVIAAEEAVEVADAPLAALEPGMVLAADLRSKGGVMLVARGHVVSEALLSKLKGFTGGIAEPVKVLVSAARALKAKAG